MLHRPSEALSTPKQTKGKQRVPRNVVPKHHLQVVRSHFQDLSGSHITDLVSPPVLKKVKNRVLHEKYVNQLRCRESRRRADLYEGNFSLSESKLLNPINITVRRLNVLKPKNIITQKSVEKLLQRHLEGDLDREGDIFSVLEPNIDISTNASQPSEALSTPKQLKENKGCLQSCTETSSSSGRKPLSRFSGSHITDLVSPSVLKKVKNRVLHEKYVNQLRCRESSEALGGFDEDIFKLI
ncbi:unnamed protein product [Sphenostylis stenocarpa]|uniref:Uncharacterized protein n=1 Tax=Sphenostylis stenocarpa TaxID=92480 RepID=A0AA86S7T7_9FABA|nr:unnamed protein product [Sphenostylis stenocarpa]